LAHGVGVAEEGRGEVLGDQGGGGVGDGVAAAAEDGETEDGGEILLGPEGSGFDDLVAVADDLVTRKVRHCGAAKEVFVFVVEGLAQGFGDYGAGVESTRRALGDHAECDLFMIGKEVIIAKFVGYPQAYEEGDGHAGGEAGDVYNGVGAVLGKMAPGDGEIIL